MGGMVIAVILQRRYRGFCGRREARLVLARKRQRWYLEDTGARTIQHFFRSIMFVPASDVIKQGLKSPSLSLFMIV